MKDDPAARPSPAPPFMASPAEVSAAKQNYPPHKHRCQRCDAPFDCPYRRCFAGNPGRPTMCLRCYGGIR